ncbi:Uncharacterized protein Fot_41642 [Forsythia ovata]|uniref:Uncharacterized protein n=1 Tax=Forsythia ovata TaxID=205694 RepID=A0ABD1RIW3_9LAMI
MAYLTLKSLALKNLRRITSLFLSSNNEILQILTSSSGGAISSSSSFGFSTSGASGHSSTTSGGGAGGFRRSLREQRTPAVWSSPPAVRERLRSAPLDFRERPAVWSSSLPRTTDGLIDLPRTTGGVVVLIAANAGGLIDIPRTPGGLVLLIAANAGSLRCDSCSVLKRRCSLRDLDQTAGGGSRRRGEAGGLSDRRSFAAMRRTRPPGVRGNQEEQTAGVRGQQEEKTRPPAFAVHEANGGTSRRFCRPRLFKKMSIH